MKRAALKPWKLIVNPNYRPSVTILVPTYNEEQTIELKLKNLSCLKYPKDLIQVILVDSASTDNTIQKALEFVKFNPKINVLVLEEKNRGGKSRALNFALKHATGEIIVVSDADCFWPPDILNEALPYLANPTIGAVAGQEKLLNPNQSWVTETETFYRDKMFCVQLGESKIHSTIQFEGGFGAYKRKILDEFDCETGADDSGTALKIVQRGARVIVIPEALFYTYFPSSWKGKFVIKVRRAHHLLSVLIKCFKLLLKRKLLLPKRIVLFEIFLLLFNPFIFMSLLVATFVVLFYYPFLALLLMLPIIIPTTRTYLVEVVQNNFIILLAMAYTLMGKKSVVWHRAKESRTAIDINTLKSKGLV